MQKLHLEVCRAINYMHNVPRKLKVNKTAWSPPPGQLQMDPLDKCITWLVSLPTVSVTSSKIILFSKLFNPRIMNEARGGGGRGLPYKSDRGARRIF